MPPDRSTRVQGRPTPQRPLCRSPQMLQMIVTPAATPTSPIEARAAPVGKSTLRYISVAATKSTLMAAERHTPTTAPMDRPTDTAMDRALVGNARSLANPVKRSRHVPGVAALVFTPACSRPELRHLPVPGRADGTMIEDSPITNYHHLLEALVDAGRLKLPVEPLDNLLRHLAPAPAVSGKRNLYRCIREDRHGRQIEFLGDCQAAQPHSRVTFVASYTQSLRHSLNRDSETRMSSSPTSATIRS